MPGWKTWAALEEVTAANMNSYLRDQVVQVFTNSASRAAAITSPTRGLVSLLTDSGSYEIYYGATTGWRPPWTQAWGLVTATAGGTGGLGIVRNVNTQGPFTANTETVLTSMTITFTAIANRFYRITYFEPRVNPAFGGNGHWDSKFRYTNISGTIISESLSPVIGTTTGAPNGLSHSTVTTITAGSQVIIVTGKISLGNTSAERGTSGPAIFSIEDIGPSTSTAPAA